jgi:hypothetical protein
MSRLSSIVALFVLPFMAAAQSANGGADASSWLAVPQAGPAAGPGSEFTVASWQGVGGSSLASGTRRDGADSTASIRAPVSLRASTPATIYAAGVQYSLTPSLHAQAEVMHGRSLNRLSLLTGTELGASYNVGPYMVGLSVGTNSAVKPNLALPRILPRVAPGVDGLSSFDSDLHVRARGRLQLGGNTGIDLGASTGRIQLLPGNALGVNTLDQSTLSFGVDHGPLSGSLVERTIQPQVAIPGSPLTSRRWSSIDLGVTWRLPWRGELSVGAQNLWSSGSAPANNPMGPEPDQSRTPYVQYHQDLQR